MSAPTPSSSPQNQNPRNEAAPQLPPPVQALVRRIETLESKVGELKEEVSLLVDENIDLDRRNVALEQRLSATEAQGAILREQNTRLSQHFLNTSRGTLELSRAIMQNNEAISSVMRPLPAAASREVKREEPPLAVPRAIRPMPLSLPPRPTESRLPPNVPRDIGGGGTSAAQGTGFFGRNYGLQPDFSHLNEIDSPSYNNSTNSDRQSSGSDQEPGTPYQEPSFKDFQNKPLG